MLKILIADDHEIVRHGLKLILSEINPHVHIEEVENGEKLIIKAKEIKWDIIITDISMPGKTGIEALIDIKKINPHIPVLVLSMHTHKRYYAAALKAGASGYLVKAIAQSDLADAIQKILSGEKYFPEEFITKPEKQQIRMNIHRHRLLSDSESRVFILLATGNSLTEIAGLLSLSISTVSKYRNRILEKMNMAGNAELTRYAFENKLI
ncbi:MAG TPA: response regulator transcription factor [Puia sp.]|nr:response regulator transcription factor [Puia sp.]